MLLFFTIVCYYEENKAAGLAVSVCGATVRPERGSALEAGAMRQKAPNSDVRKSRAVTQVQGREDVKQYPLGKMERWLEKNLKQEIYSSKCWLETRALHPP